MESQQLNACTVFLAGDCDRQKGLSEEGKYVALDGRVDIVIAERIIGRVDYDTTDYQSEANT